LIVDLERTHLVRSEIVKRLERALSLPDHWQSV
jgi:hypothetical protein